MMKLLMDGEEGGKVRKSDENDDMMIWWIQEVNCFYLRQTTDFCLTRKWKNVQTKFMMDQAMVNPKNWSSGSTSNGFSFVDVFRSISLMKILQLRSFMQVKANLCRIRFSNKEQKVVMILMMINSEKCTHFSWKIQRNFNF